jgi:hypothetical protein
MKFIYSQTGVIDGLFKNDLKGVKMPHYQICAFKNGSQILGTMDLQAVFEAKNYKRKKEYLRLFKTKTNANEYRIYKLDSKYATTGTLIETVNIEQEKG